MDDNQLSPISLPEIHSPFSKAGAMNYLLRFLASKGAEFGTFEEVRTKKPNPLTAATPIIDETQELRRKLEAREALLEKLLSSDPKVAEAAAQEWAEGKRKQS